MTSLERGGESEVVRPRQGRYSGVIVGKYVGKKGCSLSVRVAVVHIMTALCRLIGA